MPTPRQVLKKYDIRPLKRYGQSFLVDQNIITKIVESVEIERSNTIVEIGAGIGVMTGQLARKAQTVIALEIDSRMIDLLQEELKDLSNVNVIHQDILEYDMSLPLRTEHRAGKLKIVGNIPYNISSQILFRMIRFRDHISTAVLMFQKEVGDRITASPGSSSYGILSVLTSMYMVASKVMTVPPGCFYPKPRVDSVVVKLRVRTISLVEMDDHELFRKVVRQAFSKRRKTLYNNLKVATSFKLAPSKILEIFKILGIDEKRRGETLTVEEFGELSNLIGKMQKTGGRS